MNTIEIAFGKKQQHQWNTRVASRWDELTPNQVLFILKRQQAVQNPAQLLDDIAMHLLSPIPKKFPGFKRWQLDAIVEKIAWLFDETNITKNPLAQVKVNDTILYGPQDALTDCRFLEFLRANSNLTEYLKSKQPIHRDKFIACLYRTRRHDYNPLNPAETKDCRVKFNDDYTDTNAALCSRLKEEQKQAIVLFFLGCCKQMAAIFKEAFSSSDTKTGFGIHGTIDSLAGPKFGNPDQVADTYLYYILISICNYARNQSESQAA